MGRVAPLCTEKHVSDLVLELNTSGFACMFDDLPPVELSTPEIVVENLDSFLTAPVIGFRCLVRRKYPSLGLVESLDHPRGLFPPVVPGHLLLAHKQHVIT